MGEVRGRGRGRLLVVEDQRDLRELLGPAFSAEGYAVSTAASGEEALALVRREMPDLIVLDLALPGMGGVETLRRIREGGGAPRVVILTAHGTPAHVREAMALGVREFIGKPFDLDRLLRVVADEMAGAKPPPCEG
ncbi:MAG: response regulator [Gemmatimonadetes bacterium]|nr:response regulator [Gemmatimonadota bacterium]